jgi:hypothetical protein
LSEKIVRRGKKWVKKYEGRKEKERWDRADVE